MADERPTVKELAAWIGQKPETVKALVTEVALQVTKEYLTIGALAQRISLDQKTIKNKMAAGIFRKGVHYFSPKGMGPRFKWSAIVAWLEERDKPATAQPADSVPMARGYLLGSRKKSSTPIDKPVHAGV
jgi:hypothetical protein